MNFIVAVDKNWAIGKNNELLFFIKQDMQYFKKITQGKVVVMGINTLLGLPNSKPLKNRTNIVLTNKSCVKEMDCIIVHSITELFKTIKNYPEDDIFVIGGAKVYETLIPYCKHWLHNKNRCIMSCR